MIWVIRNARGELVAAWDSEQDAIEVAEAMRIMYGTAYTVEVYRRDFT